MVCSKNGFLEICIVVKTAINDKYNGFFCGTVFSAYKFLFIFTGRDINLDVLRIQGYRFFCNKIWNAMRFSLMQLEENFTPVAEFSPNGKLNEMDKWILSRAANAIKECDEGFR